MKVLSRLIGLVVAALLAGAPPAAARADVLEFDAIIRGGRLVDGGGGLPRSADVGIRGDRIVAVGDLDGARALRVIDAEGLIVAPGFIDSHSHADGTMTQPTSRLHESALVQGVTTIIGGADGQYAPSRIRELVMTFQTQGVGVNYAFFVGHNGLRQEVMGRSQQRAPNARELERMRASVREGMELGAVGLSTGLMYEPGVFSTTDEVAALARELVHFDGVYDSHTRNPGLDMVGSESEAIEIGRRAGVRVRLAHLKAVGLRNRHRISEIIQLVNAARSEGREVVADQYPYDGAQAAALHEILIVPDDPRWRDGAVPLAAVQEALQDPRRRALLRRASENGVDGGFSWIKAVGYDGFRVVDSPSDRTLEGQFIQTRAEAAGRDNFEEIAALVLSSDQPLLITLGAVDEADVRELMAQSWVMIASDGVYAPPSGAFDGGHPRSTGSFARVLGHYVRDTGLLDLPEAVRRMTSLPADFLQLRDRGRLAPGYAADIVVLDPAQVRANSTWTEPGAYASGVVHVLVNGQLAVENGRVTGVAAGRVVRRSAAAAVEN